jgi:hypothetical protein
MSPAGISSAADWQCGVFWFHTVDGTIPPEMYHLIDGKQLHDQLNTESTPGEFELLDALNLIERGDYSGAVRRVTTAIEVVVEAVLEGSLVTAEGKAAAAKFLKDTRNFARRETKYESLSRRTLSESKRSHPPLPLLLPALRDQLRQPRDGGSDSPRLVVRQHLGGRWCDLCDRWVPTEPTISQELCSGCFSVPNGPCASNFRGRYSRISSVSSSSESLAMVVV